MSSAQKKSGFVTLVGRSNVGKSTLLNTLVGTKIAITTPKPQTTRQPIRGIFNDQRGQLVFVDTPGLFLGKQDSLSLKLNELVAHNLVDIDAIVYVMDPTREPGPEEAKIQELLRASHIPIILTINKADLPEHQRPFLSQARATAIGQKTTLELSALRGTEKNRLLASLFELVPTGEAYYPAGQSTDLTHERWLAELIREKLFLHLREEVPYALHVEVTTLVERSADLMYAEAVIYTNDERYKKMVIGAQGSQLKIIGGAVRREWEGAHHRRLFLNLQVAVDAKWMNRLH